jgi:tetratricopeptide (TPR) repeat protein
MSSWLSVIVPLALLVVILVMLRPVRDAIERAVTGLRRRVAPPRQRPSTGVTIIAPDGQEYEVPPERAARPSLAARLDVVGGRGRAVLIALLVVLAVLVGVQFYRLLGASRPEQFVVLVAPFSEPNAGAGQTGREVADALVAKLRDNTGGRVVARRLGSPPADASEALATLDRAGADALIWGEVTPGGMLDRESLQPLLVYRPSGPFAPYAWEGYAGRFALPEAYVLASAPINGSVVLPALLGALSDYGAGRVDAAYDTLGALLDQYPAVAPPLPRALRGNILWARGEFAPAAEEYRRALNSLPADAGPQAAPLYNNLGAILQDANDPGAQAEFDRAIAALAGGDLSALRYNLGIQALRAANYDDAITSLEIARSPALLAPATPPAPLLLTLADTYRLAGRFDAAAPVLGAAAQQAPLIASATTNDLYNLTRTRMDAAVEAERALLDLAQAAGARGPLPWEAESSVPLPIQVLTDARRDMNQAVDNTQVLGQRWSRLAVAKDAAAEPSAGQIATRQALRAQQLLRDRRRWLAGIDIEIERTQGIQEPRGLGRVWAAIVGDRSPLGQARITLEDLVASQPTDVDSLLFLGRSYLLTGDLDKAAGYYDRAAQAAPQRPEPLYGQALVALPNDRPRARATATSDHAESGVLPRARKAGGNRGRGWRLGHGDRAAPLAAREPPSPRAPRQHPGAGGDAAQERAVGPGRGRAPAAGIRQPGRRGGVAGAERAVQRAAQPGGRAGGAGPRRTDRAARPGAGLPAGPAARGAGQCHRRRKCV